MLANTGSTIAYCEVNMYMYMDIVYPDGDNKVHERKTCKHYCNDKIEKQTTTLYSTFHNFPSVVYLIILVNISQLYVKYMYMRVHKDDSSGYLYYHYLRFPHTKFCDRKRFLHLSY